jgi:predicted transcriptional regulator
VDRKQALELANARKQVIAARRKQVALKMHGDGRPTKFIASVLGITQGQVARYVRETRNGS